MKKKEKEKTKEEEREVWRCVCFGSEKGGGNNGRGI
jgi:hypothetical protein